MGHGATQHGYRPDIDGLRAVAVIMVVLYHAWPRWLPGGFIGVDVFFVISGFLISSILLDALEHQRFSLADFYVRRIRRIFPALLTVLVACLAFGWVVLVRQEFNQLGKHVLGGAGFVANLVLWDEAGYFDNDAATKPLLHLWSLGVEEQFYLAWPLMLWALYRLRWSFLACCATVFVLSFAHSAWLTGTDATAAYFSPLSRFWELMAGGIAAHLVRRHASLLLPHGPWLGWAGGGALVLGAALIDTQTPFPGAWALLPVAGSFALILAGPQAWLNRHLLARRIPVGLGLISYPLYLWHWPLLSFAYIVLGEKPSALAKAGLMAMAVLLSVLTWRYIEMPVRSGRLNRRSIGALAGGMCVAGLAGLTVHAGLLRQRMQHEGADTYLAALNDIGFPVAGMRPLRHGGALFQQLPGSSPRLTVFIGDSVMEQFAPRVAQRLARPDSTAQSAVFATAGGCPPIEGAQPLPSARFMHCPRTMQAAYKLAAAPEVDTVVIAAAWYGYLAPTRADVRIELDGKAARFPASDAHALAYASLERSLQRLRVLGKRVVLVLQPAAGAQFDPRSMLEGSRFGQLEPRRDIAPFDAAAYRQRHAAARAALTALAGRTGAALVDPLDTLCPDSACPVLRDGVPLYTDSVHMRPFYVRAAASFLDAPLEPLVPAGLTAQAQPADARR
jgi:peptidoglycan/LPS O-acetylase OafA/YrhL